MAQDHTLKPKKISSIWQEVAAERRGSQLGYTKADLDAIPTDLSEDAQIRATTLNSVILDISDPKPLELPQKFEPNMETTPQAFFASAAQTIDELTEAVDAFGRDYLQPNHALINARQEVERLENELRAAKQKLVEIEEQGDSVSRFRKAIIKAEGMVVQGLLNRAKILVMNQLQAQKLGRILPASKLTTALKDELRLHVRVADLDGFSLLPLRELPENASKPTLEQRANRAIKQLNALAEHVQEDQEAHQAPK